MKTFLLLSALILTLAQPSFAGEGQSGNGGDVVTCPGKKPVLLDYVEGQLRDIPVDLGTATLSVREKVNLVLERVKRFSPSLSDTLGKTALAFLQDIELYEKTGKTSGTISKFIDYQLPDILDTDLALIPKNCKVEQLIVQKVPEFPQDKLFTINRELWATLDNDSKAGLVLHEAIYSLAILHGHKDSKRVRYFNAVLSSAMTEAMSFKELLELAQIVKIPFTVLFRGLPLEASSVLFQKDSDLVRAARIGEPVEINVLNNRIRALGAVTFYSDQQLKSVEIEKSSPFVFNGQSFWIRYSISFYNDGTIKTLSIGNKPGANPYLPTPTYYEIEGSGIKARTNGTIGLFGDGKLAWVLGAIEGTYFDGKERHKFYSQWDGKGYTFFRPDGTAALVSDTRYDGFWNGTLHRYSSLNSHNKKLEEVHNKFEHLVADFPGKAESTVVLEKPEYRDRKAYAGHSPGTMGQNFCSKLGYAFLVYINSDVVYGTEKYFEFSDKGDLVLAPDKIRDGIRISTLTCVGKAWSEFADDIQMKQD